MLIRGGNAVRGVSLIALLLLLWLSPRSANAAGDPQLDWWTIETKHFRIHYERGLEPIAERLAQLSEKIHERLIGPLGYEPQQRTEIALTDTTDIANGSATGLPFNTIRLFVTAPADLSPLADYDDWYLGLMTHEYTHILHVDNVSGVPSIINAILGKTLVPNQFQPRWIIEGLAVVEESRFTSGGRIRASLYDMYVRADVLENRIVRLDQMSSNAHRWPGGTMWYLYGSRFLRWIADIYGNDALRAISADYGATLVPFGINRAVRRVTGRTYPQLYAGFVKDLKRKYRKQLRAVRQRPLREGVRLTHREQTAAYPRWRQGATTGTFDLIYFRNDENSTAGHYRFTVDARSLKRRGQAQLLARTSAKTPLSFTPEGDLVFASVVPHRRIYQFHDLFFLPRGKTAPSGGEPSRKRMTIATRARAPSVSPDGRHIVFTANHRGTTTLKLADLSAEGEVSKIRTLVPSRPFEQAFTPQFSPDGRHVVYSVWTDGGYRDLRLVDVQTKRLRQLTHDRALDTGPCWSPDGKTIYFSSDRTGIFNIYAMDTDSRAVRQVTNVRTGALMPAVSPDGRNLAYIGYTSRGYDLFAMRLDPANFLDAKPSYTRPARPAEAPPVPMVKRRYSALPTLRPHNYFFEYAPGNFGSNALTLTTEGQDVAGYHSISASVVADPGAPLPQFGFNYRYLRLPVDLSLSLNNRAAPRTDYRFSDQKPSYVEHSYSVTSGLSYSDVREFSTQRLGVSHTFSALDAELPLATVGFDPYAQPTIDPLRGTLSIVHLGYSLSTLEGGRNAAGVRRGFALNLSLDFGDETIGSDETVFAGRMIVNGYVPMPWPGDHTLPL